MSDESELSSRLKAILTVGLVVATFAVAAVGYLQVRADSKSSDAAQAGQEYAIKTMSDLLQSQEGAKVNYEHFLHAQEQRGQAGNAFQQSLFSGAGEKSLLRIVQERWQRLAAKTQALTPLTTNGKDGPRDDLEFPRHYFARSTAGALRYQALQDAANSTNSGWQSRAAKYTAVLTLLAVAVYLFGFALAMPRRVLGIFGSVGALMLVVGVGWAAAITADTPKTIPKSAADEFSLGEVALETSSDAAGFQSSIDHFTKAIDAWPGFARAYLGRANATLTQSAPELQSTLIPVEALERVISDLKQSRERGLGSGLLFQQLAASEFTLALHDQPALFRKAVTDARHAIDEAPNDPVGHYSLAISLLGTGDVDAARDAYRDAIDSTIHLAVDGDEPRNAPQFEQVWVSGALSDLEALGDAKPDVGDEIDRLKELIVGSVAAGGFTEPSGNASFPGLQSTVTPTTVAWLSGGQTGYDRERNRLSVQWYTKSGDHTWIGMPEVSGAVNPQLDTSVPRYLARNLTSSSIPPRCLGSADYRVELYVDGHLAGDAETTAPWGDQQAFIDRALNLEACYPPSWKRSKFELPGYRQGFDSPDGTKGIYLIRYDLALLPQRLRGKPTAQITDGLLVSTMNTSRFLLPKKPFASSPAQHQNSLGLPGSTQRSFFYENGLAYVQCALDERDKAAFVLVVFGPQASFQQPAGDLLPVTASLSEYRFGGGSF